MERPYRVTSTKYSQYESRYQGHGRQIMEHQEKFRQWFHFMVCLHDDCRKSFKKKNSIIN
jgi:hypothetical protein